MVYKRKIVLFTFVLLLAVGGWGAYAYGEEDQRPRYGFSVLGGTGEAWRSSPDMKVFGFFPRVTLPLNKKWDFEIEGNYSYWDISQMEDLYFLGFNLNIVLIPIRWNWGSLFLLVGGGLGYDSAGGKVYYMGDQHFGGILQGGMGLNYYLGKGLALRAEYRFYHVSEPFYSDYGLNTHCFLLGVSF